MPIIECLEVIGIDHHHRQRFARTLGAEPLVAQGLIEHPPIGHAGQRIGGGQLRQFLLGLWRRRSSRQSNQVSQSRPMHSTPVAPLITIAVRLHVANTSSLDSATMTVNGRLPTLEKVYRRCSWSRLDMLVKLPLPSLTMRRTLGRLTKFLPIEFVHQTWLLRQQNPVVVDQIQRTVTLPMFRLLNNWSK